MSVGYINCHQCRKRLFRTKLDAMMALAEIRQRDRSTAQEKRAYRCPHRRVGWHLTKQDRRPPR